MTNTVLVIASHPDDEVLGVGGTIARHVAAGDTVHSLIVAEGATSRPGIDDMAETKALCAAATAAAGVLSAEPPRLLGLPDNRLDTLALLDIVQPIEAVIAELKPQTVYTHFAGDMNRDHAITAEAVEIACRPLPGQSVSALYAFETVSSTEWGIGNMGFMPQVFIEIVGELDLKIKALRCYDSEMRPFPHARSYEAVKALARLRGAQSGVGAAEAFMVRRELRR
ncbi:MAG: hypothetical protein CFH41_01245 [Alphaproteobacteria bacterium MarineAlpha11_Bin1]|nr:MAG: hypothetical protein CFH41_01245 [Alphaproteobacteria bacterium MarineAlpha11_Bin1]|tara:strand:+ start:4553 stop:5227 length:675 start_codon:yes stop_codon:yes gene_type:complete